MLIGLGESTGCLKGDAERSGGVWHFWEQRLHRWRRRMSSRAGNSASQTHRGPPIQVTHEQGTPACIFGELNGNGWQGGGGYSPQA